MGSGYGRSSSQVQAPELSEQSDGSAKNLRNIYDDIKNENKAQSDLKVQKMRERMTPGDQPRVRNASPFYKDQQAQRFGLSGAKKITSMKERREEALIKQKSTTEILEGQFKTYRDEQKMKDGATAQWNANKMQTDEDV